MTFANEIFGDPTSLETVVLVSAWVVYLLSIFGGVWTMLALTGTLEPANGSSPDASIRGGNIRLPSIFQTVTFAVATALIVLFGGLSVF